LRDDAYERHRKFRKAHPGYMAARIAKMRRDVPGYDFLTSERRAVLARKRAALKAAKAARA
jgi:hypothetical protein